MILARANELQASIRFVQERSRRLEHLQGIRSHAQKLAERAEEIRGLLACRNALIARGQEVRISSNLALVAAEAMRSVQRRIASDAAVSADPAAFADTWTALNKIVTGLRSALRVAWQSYADDRIPSLNSDVLNVLRRLADLRQKVARVEQRLGDLRSRRDTPLLRPEEIEAFDVGVKEVESLWHTLGGDTLPPEVLRFLQDSGTGGAALDSLTPVVTEWLRDNHLWTAFRIGIARDAAESSSRR
jgi:hypothetical protein